MGIQRPLLVPKGRPVQVIESEQPTLGAPDRSMISYAQYIMEKYPAGEAVDQTTQARKRGDIASQPFLSDVDKGEDGDELPAPLLMK